MAKKSMINRERRRAASVEKQREKRGAIKVELQSHDLSFEQRLVLTGKLAAMKRDGSAVRGRNRCAITGRPRGVYRKFSLCRNKLRELAMSGQIPGLRKASW